MDSKKINDDSPIKIEDAVRFISTKQRLKQLYFDASKGKKTNPVIGIRRGLLQRKLQIEEWRKDDRKRVKEFLYSLFKGTADTDSLMLIPIDLVTSSLEEKLDDAIDKSSKDSIRDTIKDVAIDIKDGIQFYLLDGQNRIFEAIIPFMDGEVSLGEKKLYAIDTSKNNTRTVLSGKSYKDLPIPVKEFFDNIEVYIHFAEKGDIDSFIEALIAKNSNVGWIDWQKQTTENTFTKFRKQIGQVINNDEDNFIIDKVFSNIKSVDYKPEKDGYELLISEMLIWMKTLTQPKKGSTNMQSQFFKGEDGNVISESMVVELTKYLREFATVSGDPQFKKTVKHTLVRNYVMFRYAMEHSKSMGFKTLVLPNWKIEKEAEFVAQYFIVTNDLYKDKNAWTPIYHPRTKQIAKYDKVPGYLPYATSGYTKTLLMERIRIISEALLKKETVLSDGNVITIIDSDKMPSVETVATNSNMKDYKGRKVYGVEVVTGKFQRGHVTPGSKGGSNTDLKLQPSKSNQSYGANPL
tara:strand:- start:50 stop:1612 length:1563 start_codon:yes stop_codon:yes gene_type:complete